MTCHHVTIQRHGVIAADVGETDPYLQKSKGENHVLKMHPLLIYIYTHTYMYIAKDHELDHEGKHMEQDFQLTIMHVILRISAFFVQGKSKFIDISKFNPIPSLSNSSIFFKFLRTYLPTCIHTYMHACMHAYIYLYRYIQILEVLHLYHATDSQVFPRLLPHLPPFQTFKTLRHALTARSLPGAVWCLANGADSWWNLSIFWAGEKTDNKQKCNRHELTISRNKSWRFCGDFFLVVGK